MFFSKLKLCLLRREAARQYKKLKSQKYYFRITHIEYGVDSALDCIVKRDTEKQREVFRKAMQKFKDYKKLIK